MLNNLSKEERLRRKLKEIEFTEEMTLVEELET